MKNLIQRALFWALRKTGWKPEEKIQLLRVREKFFRPRIWSGNAHQRRTMKRAWERTYPSIPWRDGGWHMQEPKGY